MNCPSARAVEIAAVEALVQVAGETAAITASGAGGRYPSDECGRTALQWRRHVSTSTSASFSVQEILPLTLSQQPLSQAPAFSLGAVFVRTARDSLDGMLFVEACLKSSTAGGWTRC
jgi:hypothetical protein